MFIHEVIIEGFKSYAQRTVVGPFDSAFNAITGFNGSGKSNILDAICFVLGISNLSQVRASNLQELVYKQGQAGVTKATVTIVFNNMDKKQSPLGYEDCDEITVTRQIIIGGRNKYLINGVNAQQQRVQNLFHSVQLNVNNPHFLIMQGRITKVLNMKPMEILSMIEEAAGTRMFENKKDVAIKTIEKKDRKLEEIAKILDEEITPTLEKLRKERSSYLEYQKTQMECERLLRFCIAFDFASSEKLAKSSIAELQTCTQEMAQLSTLMKAKETRAIDVEQNISLLEKKKNKETGGSLEELERTVTDLSKELVRVNSTFQHKKESHEAEVKSCSSLAKAKQETEESIMRKEQEKAVMVKEHASLKNLSDEASEQLEQLQRRIHGFSVAKSENGGSNKVKTFADELMEAKQAISSTNTEQKECKMKITHLQSELKKKEKESKATEKEFKKLETELENIQNKVSQLAAQLPQTAFDANEEVELTRAKAAQDSIITELKDKCDALSAKLSALEFAFSDPEPKFDRSKVKGLVANLITVKEPSVYSTALEITAGGRLYNVVVDTEATGAKLLKNGKLRKRVTIIPLNKIQGHVTPAETIKLAEKAVGKGNVQTALSLVGYDEEIETAMQYVFGTTLVCKTMDLARQVTFNPSIRARTVTLDGDIFDPSGTLTGGASTPACNSILTQLSQLTACKQELAESQQRSAEIEAKLAALRKTADSFSKIAQQQQLALHEADLVRNRMKQNTHHLQLEQMKAMTAEIASLEESLKGAAEKEEQSIARCTRIEADMKMFNSKRESEAKKAEGEISKAKADAAKALDATRSKEQQVEALTLELEELHQEVKSLMEQICQSQVQIATLEKEAEQCELDVANKKQEYENAKVELAKKREKIASADREIQALSKERDECRQAATDAEIEYKKLEYNVQRLQKAHKDASKTVDAMMKKHEWIASEKAFFGVQDTAYDFAEKDPEDCRRRLIKLEEAQSKIAKSINMKVLNMFGKAEQEYNDLMKKKKIVENDKSKIEAAIQELDVRKKEALKKTYVQVNRDFGSIFSTLLPGTNAKLAPTEGKTELEGLEVKVAFGGVWKQSLTELSGGQRSLIALSLILALLLFKPAPMYILDEVDAALDLSHTQNIGQMLRTHFSQSQFIVVSLKDGMFNNANVLFKTKFVDGVSTVSRTAQSPKAFSAHSTMPAFAKAASNVASSSSSTSSSSSALPNPSKITSSSSERVIRDEDTTANRSSKSKKHVDEEEEYGNENINDHDDEEKLTKSKGKGKAKAQSKPRSKQPLVPI